MPTGTKNVQASTIGRFRGITRMGERRVNLVLARGVAEILSFNTVSTHRRKIMELQIARQILDTLAQGIHPVTGEAMPEDSPYNAPPVIRALHTVARALEGHAAAPAPARTTRAAPANAGKAWSAEDDAVLETGFDAGTDLKQLAETLARTRFGVEQRLIKLGKMPSPAGGGRFGNGAARAS
jgi:hypothetical protein